MAKAEGPQLIDEGVIVCCGYRYEVRVDDTFFEAPEEQWQHAQREDGGDSLWSPVDEVDARALHGPFVTGALHTRGVLRQGEELLSIRVYDWLLSEWIAPPFAVARGRLWVAHLPRWPTEAEVKTSLGTEDYRWVHRRCADHEQDMPDGLRQIPPSSEAEKSGDVGFGWITYKQLPPKDVPDS